MNDEIKRIAEQDELEHLRTYVSAHEILKRLSITRASLTHAVARGQVPPPIKVTDKFYLWKRETVEPSLIQWQIAMEHNKK